MRSRSIMASAYSRGNGGREGLFRPVRQGIRRGHAGYGIERDESVVELCLDRPAGARMVHDRRQQEEMQDVRARVGPAVDFGEEPLLEPEPQPPVGVAHAKPVIEENLKRSARHRLVQVSPAPVGGHVAMRDHKRAGIEARIGIQRDRQRIPVAQAQDAGGAQVDPGGPPDPEPDRVEAAGKQMIAQVMLAVAGKGGGAAGDRAGEGYDESPSGRGWGGEPCGKRCLCGDSYRILWADGAEARAFATIRPFIQATGKA